MKTFASLSFAFLASLHLAACVVTSDDPKAGAAGAGGEAGQAGQAGSGQAGQAGQAGSGQAGQAGSGTAEQPKNLCPKSSAGPTEHKGNIEQDEVWTAEGSPHIVRYQVNVRKGATLTIEPCATVLVAADTALTVGDYNGDAGTLVASGEAEKPITIKGLDGARWNDLVAYQASHVTLKHVSLEGGGGDKFARHASLVVHGDGKTPARKPLFVEHVSVEGSLGAGVWLTDVGAFADGSSDLRVSGSGDDENPYPLVTNEHALSTLPSGDYKGNKRDEILLRPEGANQTLGGLQDDATMHELGVPYHVGDWESARLHVGDVDGKKVTLTIEPGVVLRFHKGAGMEVEHFDVDQEASGAVVAVGTPEKPIVFTSAEASPAPGDWMGIWFGSHPRAENRIENARIEYAGGESSWVLVTCSDFDRWNAALIFSYPPPSGFVKSTAFAHIGGHGVLRGWRADASPDFAASNTFDDLQGCVQTLNQPAEGPCPNPKPSCQ